MGMVKFATKYICLEDPNFRIGGVHPNWEMHPAWTAGIKALDAYNQWVAEVVMPITFQWIEEHKAEVYENIPEELWDDVGVVIASAFELIKGMKAYKQGLEQYEVYKKAVEDDTWKTKNINPIWTAIAEDVQAATKTAFDTHKPVLKDTVR